MRFVRRHVRWLPFVIALAMLGAAMGWLLVTLAFGWGNTRVIYWMAYWASKSFNGWSVAVPGLFLGSGLIYVFIEIVLKIGKRDRQIHSIAAASVFVVWLASLVLCGAVGITRFQSGPLGFKDHLETVRLPNRVYHLLVYNYDAGERYNDTYALYECDGLDFLCQRIYSIPRSVGGSTPDVTSIHIRPDGASDGLILEINGKVEHRHQPQ